MGNCLMITDPITGEAKPVGSIADPEIPQYTYAEWVAAGSPDIPWIRTDAPDDYRKVSGDDVSYDNTSSGLTATDVQSAIDEVNTNKQNEFELLGSVRGVGDVALPGTWKEIIVQVTGSQNAILTTHFLRRMTTNTAVNASLGNYGTSYAVGSIATTFVHLSVMNWAGQDITSTSTMYVYVRE